MPQERGEARARIEGGFWATYGGIWVLPWARPSRSVTDCHARASPNARRSSPRAAAAGWCCVGRSWQALVAHRRLPAWRASGGWYFSSITSGTMQAQGARKNRGFLRLPQGRQFKRGRFSFYLGGPKMQTENQTLKRRDAARGHAPRGECVRGACVVLMVLAQGDGPGTTLEQIQIFQK